MKARLTLVLWIALAIAIAATQGRGESAGSALGTPAATSGITRTVLVGATPASDPDHGLQLARIEIQPGVTLPAHVHPGMQIAWISAGELTYYVVRGEARIERASEDGAPGSAELLGAGGQTVLHVGDAVIETEDMLHYGANLGDEPVVILAASLLEADQPPTIVEATPAS